MSSSRLPGYLQLSRLRAELDRLFAEAAELDLPPTGERTFQPAVDVIETAGAVRLEVDLPAVAASDVTLTIEGPEIVLSGIRRDRPTPEGARFHALETPRGRFSRRIHVAWLVNTHLGHARLADGVLVIEFPKIAEQRQRSHSIRIESDDP